MEDVYGVEEYCKTLRLILLLSSPANVKDIKLIYKVEEEDAEECILSAYISIWIKTLEGSFILDVFCDADEYKSQSREEVEDSLQFHTYENLRRFLDNKEYEYFWNSVDFENQDWKRKEG